MRRKKSASIAQKTRLQTGRAEGVILSRSRARRAVFPALQTVPGGVRSGRQRPLPDMVQALTKDRRPAKKKRRPGGECDLLATSDNVSYVRLKTYFTREIRPFSIRLP
jgi:hypothetical protein